MVEFVVLWSITDFEENLPDFMFQIIKIFYDCLQLSFIINNYLLY